MKSKLLPLLVLIALSSLVVAGLINVFGTLAGPFAPPPGEEGEGVWTVCEISAEGGPSPHILLFTVYGAAHTSYLRETVTTHYDSRTGVWRLESNRPHYQYDGEVLARVVPDAVQEAVLERILVFPVLDIGFSVSPLIPRPTPVLTSLYPLQVSYPSPLTYFPEEHFFSTEMGRLDDYSFSTVHYSFDESTLRQAEVDVDDVYLKLPSGISGRIKSLAREITANLDSPYEKARAIEAYLENNYVYDLYYDHAPWGEEPNDWFLFEEKKGVCANFNSAFVILCRAVGIPARLVSGYLITPQAEEQEVYADKAHAWAEVAFSELGWVTFDATGTQAAPAAPLTPTETRIDEIMGTGETFKKGDSFTVKGVVVGRFTEEYDITPEVVEFERIGLRSHVTKMINIEYRSLPNMIVQVFLNSWKGPGGLLVGECEETSSQGEFEVTCTVPREISAGDYHVMAKTVATDEYAESWSDPEIKVVSDTSIEISLPKEVYADETVDIGVSLREEPSYWVGEGYEKRQRWNPVPDEEVEVYVDGELVEKAATGSGGAFSLSYTFTEGSHKLRAEFKGTDYHLASSREVSIWLLPPLAFPWFYFAIPLGLVGALAGYMLLRRRDFSRSHLYLLLILMLVGIGFAVYGLYGEEMYPWIYLAFTPIAVWLLSRGYSLYRQLTRKSTAGPVSAPEVPLEVEPATEGVEAGEAIPSTPVERKKAKEGTLAIEFPQIGESLPDVWGVGDELQISCSLKDGHREVAAETMEVYLDKNLLSEVQVDESGKGDLVHTIQAKGEYVVGGRLRKSKGERLIRIVDYREEIVNLFNSLLKQVQAEGTDIPSESTPREIQQRLLNAQAEINEKLVEQIIECFEEAEYSQHPMKRHHYEMMFLSQRALFSQE